MQLDWTSRAYNRASKAARRLRYLPSSRRYNLTICHSHRFVWFRVAKTGTRTLLNELKGAGAELAAEHPMDVHYPPDRYAEYLRFAIVRNPWDRLVSCWHNKIVDQNWWQLDEQRHAELQEFEKFVTWVESVDVDDCDVHLRRQSSVIDLNHLDYLGRFERYAETVADIMRRVGLSARPLPKLNASRSRAGYQSYYTDALAERVAQLYEMDVQLFDYSFDGKTPG